MTLPMLPDVLKKNRIQGDAGFVAHLIDLANACAHQLANQKNALIGLPLAAIVNGRPEGLWTAWSMSNPSA